MLGDLIEILRQKIRNKVFVWDNEDKVWRNTKNWFDYMTDEQLNAITTALRLVGG